MDLTREKRGKFCISIVEIKLFSLIIVVWDGFSHIILHFLCLLPKKNILGGRKEEQRERNLIEGEPTADKIMVCMASMCTTISIYNTAVFFKLRIEISPITSHTNLFLAWPIFHIIYNFTLLKATFPNLSNILKVH